MDGSQRYVSGASERLTGWTPEQFMALDRMSTFHPEDWDIALAVMDSMNKGKREHRFRYRMAQKAGGWLWVEAYAQAYSDKETGRILGYVGTIRDISAMKQTEEGWERERRKLSQDRQSLVTLALTDVLTGLSNRRAFDEALSVEFYGVLRGGNPATLMMIDVDFFKLYNDHFGHLRGDECLRQIARALQSSVGRTGDLVARWGGEEFAALLPSTDREGGQKVAAEMLAAVKGLAMAHPKNPFKVVTVSIGLACLESDEEGDASLWVQRADRALYASKGAGRDRVTAG